MAALLVVTPALKRDKYRIYRQIAVRSAPVRDFYLVRFWSPRSGVSWPQPTKQVSAIQVAGIPLNDLSLARMTGR